MSINGWGGQKTGHGNHQDSGYQTPKAVEAAADPTKYPDQIAEGLKPWRVEMILNPVRATAQDEKVDYTGSWVVPADEISPIWGLSYRDISLEGYLHHRSQGVTPFLNSPFIRRPYGLKRATGGPPSPSDFAQPITSLARRDSGAGGQIRSRPPIMRWTKRAWRRKNSTGPAPCGPSRKRASRSRRLKTR